MNYAERKRLWHLLSLIGVALIGLACSSLFNGVDFVHSTAYVATASTLLFVGLYMAVFGIDKAEAKKEWRVVLVAVTFGVLCKYLLIFGLTYAVTRRWEYAILAMAITQIDPLSVAAISGDARMSKRTKTVLGAWASFDDPITAIMTPILISLTAIFAQQDISTSVSTHWLVGGVALVAGLIVFALAMRFSSAAQKVLEPVVITLSAVGVVLTKLFIWAALLGWFVRPAWLQKGKRADWVTLIALGGATFLLGILLSKGVDWRGSLVLGIAAFIAQMIATSWVLSVAGRIRRNSTTMHEPFSKRDKRHLALAQQNGITAIVLALNLEPSVPNAVAVVSFAIVVINVLNFAANWVNDRIGA